MAKLILSLDQVTLEEFTLDKPRLTVGRKPINDIQIDNLAVSGEHAVIVKIGNDFFVEDLDSTNGTLVNDKVINKHLLQHADVIEFGKYQLKYINEALLNQLGVNGDDDFEKTMIIRPSSIKAPLAPDTIDTHSAPAASHLSSNTKPIDVPANTHSTPLSSATQSVSASEGGLLGKIQVLSGSSTGRELLLSKALTTLGKPGVQVAVITKRANGYYITHVEGKSFPVVNGASIGAQAQLLADHDVVELAGVKMEFYIVNK